MWQSLIKLFSFLVFHEGIFSRKLSFYNNFFWQIFWANISQQINVGIEEMNVKCKICYLWRIFETVDRLQKIKRKSSKSGRVSSCWNKSFLQPLLKQVDTMSPSYQQCQVNLKNRYIYINIYIFRKRRIFLFYNIIFIPCKLKCYSHHFIIYMP